MRLHSFVGPRPARQEEHELIRQAQAGDRRAMDRLIQIHTGLVVKRVRMLLHFGVPFDDLLQEGTIGLMIAVERFDLRRKDARLVIYASHWIRAKLYAYVLANRGPVRFGTNKADRKVIFGLSRSVRAIIGRGETVTAEALSTEMGVSQEVLAQVVPRLSGVDVPIDADDAQQIADDRQSVEDRLADLEEQARRRHAMQTWKRQLEKRERAILRWRHPARGEPHTLQQIADRYGLSRERVRQLEKRALKLLRERAESV